MVQLRSWMILAEAYPGTLGTLKGAVENNNNSKIPLLKLRLRILIVKGSYILRRTQNFAKSSAYF